MKHFNTLFLIACLISATFVSCNKKEVEEKEPLSVDRTELILMQKDGSADFNISSSGEWHIDAEGLEGYYGPNMGDVKDFTIAPVTGNGNTKVSVTLKNEVTESYDIDITITGKKEQLTVKLKAVAN
ncbi:MAG: hypothetical protein LBK53_04195 [Heliobacteriaceae bacterium]|jgi:hypothetical protein|nr:hypothetical protein [Heliobacteriaceae bacterium]